MKVEFNFTKENLDKLIDATCFKFNYQGENGETKAQFTKRMWKEQMIECVKMFELNRVIVDQETAKQQITSIDIQ